MDTPNQFEIAGPVFKPATQYLTSQGYPLGTTCWFFEVKINRRSQIICGDTIADAWAAVNAHLHAEGGLPNIVVQEVNTCAAQELLQGCLAALAYLADPPSEFPENRAEAVSIIRAAIAKATNGRR